METEPKKTDENVQDSTIKMGLDFCKKNYPQVVNDAKNRLYLATGYVSAEVTCAGTTIVCKTLKKVEKDYLSRITPSWDLSDNSLFRVLTNLSSSMTDEEVTMLLEKFWNRSDSNRKLTNIMLVFGVVKFDGDDVYINFDNSMLSLPYDELIKVPKIADKIALFDLLPDALVQGIIAKISELSNVFNYVMHELMENPNLPL